MNKFFVVASVSLVALAQPTVIDQFNFDELVISEDKEFLSDKGWFIKFYAPWCGQCKAIEPIWLDFSLADLEINVGKVDCTNNAKLCNGFGVNKYPTIIYFPADEGYGGSYFRYEGPRTYGGFFKFSLGGGWKPADDL